jgi:hypothetical protein
MDDFNPDGSSLLLRPSAPVYCCDLDPAALGGGGTHTPQPPAAAAAAAAAAAVGPGGWSSQPLGGMTQMTQPSGSPAATDSLQGGSVGPDVTLLGASSGVAGIGSRCGYRADGFGPPEHTQGFNSSRTCGPGGGHVPQAAAHVSPAAAAAAAAATAGAAAGAAAATAGAAGGAGSYAGGAGGAGGVSVLKLTVPPSSGPAGKSEEGGVRHGGRMCQRVGVG